MGKALLVDDSRTSFSTDIKIQSIMLYRVLNTSNAFLVIDFQGVQDVEMTDLADPAVNTSEPEGNYFFYKFNLI